MNQFYCPKSDAYIEVGKGLELCARQLFCIGNRTCTLYAKFKQTQKHHDNHDENNVGHFCDLPT